MAGALIKLAGLGATLIGTSDANTFLKANPAGHKEWMSEADVQTTLLSEIEGTFGEGSASSRVKQLEQALAPMYAALPKNEHGYLGHSTVRYALHRLFVQRHGWIIQGLDVAGGHRNLTTGAGVLNQHIPAYIQDLIEKRLGGRGFGLHELGVVAATLEHLVHSETIKRLGDVLKLDNKLATDGWNVTEADDVLDTYMMFFILGEDIATKNQKQAKALKKAMYKIYNHWTETQGFIRELRQNVTQAEASVEQRASGQLDFSLVARVADRAGEQFGAFQNQECKDMKAQLVKMEDAGTGRVRLSQFYKPALDGHWQFQESVGYLRQLGALDETGDEARVIIPNFITSQSNCIASSSFYSVCCMDECEGLLNHLETSISAPEAWPAQIAQIVSNLPSSSVSAPRQLPETLLDRLGEIAAEHGGSVPLHGRLFAQWMHHAFPRECPYPHVAGTTSPLTPDEWLKENGGIPTATSEEMQEHVIKAQTSETGRADEEPQSLPWAPEEELLIQRTSTSTTNSRSPLRSLALAAAMLAAVYGFARNVMTTAKTATGAVAGLDKFLV